MIKIKSTMESEDYHRFK